MVLKSKERLLDIEIKTQEERSGRFGGFLNVLGIFLAGGLGGYVFLRDKEQEEKETMLKNELRSEKANLSKLEYAQKLILY